MIRLTLICGSPFMQCFVHICLCTSFHLPMQELLQYPNGVKANSKTKTLYYWCSKFKSMLIEINIINLNQHQHIYFFERVTAISLFKLASVLVCSRSANIPAFPFTNTWWVNVITYTTFKVSRLMLLHHSIDNLQM